MSIAHEPVFQWLSQFAYEPYKIYTFVVVMMILSSFGLPFPEELTLISAGLLAFMGTHPEIFPPPVANYSVINPIHLAVVASMAVFSADFMIYLIGRKGGRKIIRHPRLQKIFSPALLKKAEEFTKNYGTFATAIFRFTPGVRFPGHLLCGTLRFPAWKFILIDGLAVAISVPTQVLLLAHYGEPILKILKKFKIALAIILAVALIVYLVYRWRNSAAKRKLELKSKP